MNRIALALAAISAVLFVAPGCAKKTIVGTWKFDDIILSSQAQAALSSQKVDISKVKDSMKSTQLVFKDQKTFELTGPRTMGGTYTVTGDNIALHVITINGQDLNAQISGAEKQLKDHPAQLKQFQDMVKKQNPSEVKATMAAGKIDLDSQGSKIVFAKAQA